MPSLRFFYTLAVFCAAPLVAQTPTAQAPGSHPSSPEVGSEAPDFVAAWGDSAGIKATPLVLHELRGRVVVLAFYPADRTGGCTMELEHFRDHYATLFGTGDVVVLPISVDSVESHVSWAKDMHFPFSLVSDVGGKVAAKYGSIAPGHSVANRTIFVIGKDGKIAYTNLRVNVLDDHTFDELGAAVKKANGA